MCKIKFKSQAKNNNFALRQRGLKLFNTNNLHCRISSGNTLRTYKSKNPQET